MEPLIKWPGGKKREAEYVRRLLPERFDRYVEPFFGGGGVCFALMDGFSDIPIIANDIDRDLIRFYTMVKENSPALRQHLYAIWDEWRCLEAVSAALYPVVAPLLDTHYARGAVPPPDCPPRLAEAVRRGLAEQQAGFRPGVDFAALTAVTLHCVTDKIFKLIDLEKRRRAARLTAEERMANLEAGVKSGYYSYLRGVRLSGGYIKHRPIDTADGTAVFFFLREFCYGSMFRFNAAGQFNIPYGGLSYNRKDFAAKVDRLFGRPAQALLGRTEFRSVDFRAIMASVAAGDFVFLDPPYDSEFSAYGQNDFGLDDHVDLARRFSRLAGRGVLIIKDTPRIHSIYEGYVRRRELYWLNYAKRYAYNMRGRNDRAADHLLITNFPTGD